jgi:hypothetical protein
VAERDYSILTDDEFVRLERFKLHRSGHRREELLYVGLGIVIAVALYLRLVMGEQ